MDSLTKALYPLVTCGRVATLLRVSLDLSGFRTTRNEILVGLHAFADILMLTIKIHCSAPCFHSAMFGYGDGGINNLQAHARHDANLKYRCEGAALLTFHAAQNTLYLTCFIEINLAIIFVPPLLLQHFKLGITRLC